jgi:Cytochrome c7 and related cytochrome c
MNYKKFLFIGLLLIGVALAMAACSTPSATPCPDCPPAPECPAAECPTCPEVPACPTLVVDQVPNEAEWAASPHADETAEAFRHWDEDDPKEVPTSCAQCHSPTGYMDFLGADGSAAGVVDAAQPPADKGITCVACHNEVASDLSEVTFPSGTVVSDLGPEARCMVCHQGRASGANIDSAIATNVLTDTLDAPSTELRFTNIHYYAAAATLYGSVTHGGYEYAGNTYDGKFLHAAGINTCVGCHNPHTLEIRVETCQECHTEVASAEDLRSIRMNGSLEDYDGDGDVTEGINAEITGLQELLLTAIQTYGRDAGTPLAYDPAAHPYFFNDANDNGTVDPEEAESEEAAFASWTARLLKAAYNYQLSVKDPGAFAHNAKYIIQLLFDSVADLNTVLSTPVDLAAANRVDAGHFAASEEAFRHWDEDGEVPGSCAKCHSATGLPVFLENSVSINQPLSQGLDCETCHDEANFPAVYSLAEVEFPSGAVVTFGEGAPANLCLNCHQGRESTVSVDRAIGDNTDDTVVEGLSFRNPHYFGAGASLFGTEAQGAYEYTGQTYLGHHGHVDLGQTCVTCHNTHELGINEELCAACHGGATDPATIRMGTTDYDGDGDTTEGMSGEVATMTELVYAALQTYAAETIGTPLVYDALAHPYFYIDTNADGVTDPEDVTGDTRYVTWTPRLLRGAYNYQWAQKDPGAFAHNGKYILQTLYDSLADLGGDVTGLTRP